jgi:hypothetical protein
MGVAGQDVGRIRWQRWGAAAGVAAVGFFIAAFAVGVFFGELPNAHASAHEVGVFFAAHADKIELGALLAGIGLLLFVVLLAVLADTMRESAATPAAVYLTRLGGNGLAIMLGLGVAALAAASYHAQTETAPVAQGLQDIGVAFVSFSGFPGAAVGAGVGAFAISTLAGSERLWLGGLSCLTVVFQLAATVGLVATTGPFNPYDGIVTSIGAFELLLWMFALSVFVATHTAARKPKRRPTQDD